MAISAALNDFRELAKGRYSSPTVNGSATVSAYGRRVGGSDPIAGEDCYRFSEPKQEMTSDPELCHLLPFQRRKVPTFALLIEVGHCFISPKGAYRAGRSIFLTM